MDVFVVDFDSEIFEGRFIGRVDEAFFSVVERFL